MISRIAQRYGRALFLEARGRKELDAVQANAELIDQVFAQEPLLSTFFASPVVDDNRKLAILTETFGKAVKPLTLQFLKLMNSKNRDAQIHGAMQAFSEHYREHKGIVTAVVTSAVELDDTQRKAIETKVREHTGKDAVQASYRTDANLIGGFTVRIGSTLLDGSLKRQIERLRVHLESGSITNGASAA